jgi:hypothetical protein
MYVRMCVCISFDAKTFFRLPMLLGSESKILRFFVYFLIHDFKARAHTCRFIAVLYSEFEPFSCTAFCNK